MKCCGTGTLVNSITLEPFSIALNHPVQAAAADEQSRPSRAVLLSAAVCCCVCVPQEEKRAAKASERQEELRQASMDDPLSASGVKMPPERPYTHDGREVIDAVKSGDVDSLLWLCADVPPAKDGVNDDGGTTKKRRKQTGADVDYIPTGDDEASAGGPPLHLAVGLGDTAMAAALLSKACGADVDVFNPRTGYTPLHLATAEDRPAVISVLIENGAHLDMRSNEAGMSALHLAVTRAARNPAGAASESANLSAGLRDGCAHVLLAAGASIELEDHRKLYTPLHMSAGYGTPEVAHLLLSFGAAMTAEDESGQIPVQLAGHHNPNYPRRPGVRDLLVSESEDPTLTGAWLSNNGLSVLARHFDAAGLGALEDVFALEGIEDLTGRIILRKKQRKKLESLLKRRGVKKEL